jgi:hypothetical protein
MTKKAKAKALKFAKPKKPPKAAKDIPGAAFANEERDAKRASFLHHRSSWTAVQAKFKATKKLVDDVVDAMKADGHTKKEMEFADMLAGDCKQEIKAVADVEMKLRVGSYMGHSIGNQLDLFAQSVAAAPNPYDEGKQCHMEGGRASPPKHYAPGSPQYTRWLEGFHDEQERRVKAGIKPLGGDGTLEDEPAGEEAADDDGNPVAEVGAKPDPARPFSDFH